MSPLSRSRLASAVGAACLVGFQPSAFAALIDYSYTGVVTQQRFQGCNSSCSNVLSGTVGKAFNALVRIDTSTGDIESFTVGISGVAEQWLGTGGKVTHSATSLIVDIGVFSGGATSIDDVSLAGLLGYVNVLDLVGPTAAFGNFIDGYATTFNVGAMTTRGGRAFVCDPSYADFDVNLTAVSGRVVPGPDAKVPEPGTIALAGLAGLAALRSVRRRKAAAA